MDGDRTASAIVSDKRRAIAARLERIAARNAGRLTPDDVLADAMDKRSPLHDQFDWDDSEAAHKWRLSQARELIRSVKVQITTETRVISTVRYIRDPAAEGEQQGYVEVAKLCNERDLARSALKSELASARALFDRALSLARAFDMEKEFVGLIRHAEEVEGVLDQRQ